MLNISFVYNFLRGAGDMVDDYYRRIRNLKIQLGIATDDDLDHPKSNAPNPRHELLGLKQRNVSKAPASDDLDELLNYHENTQAKIADDMLILTRSLKEQSQLANKIIKKDTEIVGRSAQLSENNLSKLKVESDKLQEHSKRACKCWMWIMLVIVLVVFISKFTLLTCN